MNEQGNREIPFGKPARVGNYKVWRTKKTFGRKLEKTDIEQINVSTLDGEWQIKIPSTCDMYYMLRSLFARSDDDRLSSIFTNMACVSVTANGYYHQAVSLLTVTYNNPTLLDESDKDHETLLHNVSVLTKAFLDWRKGYDEMVADNEPTDEDMRSDDVADEMLEQLENGNGEKT